MKSGDRQDDGFQLRVQMTFSEHAHPRFIQALRAMPPHARSRLIRTLVERALAVGGEQDLQGRGSAPGLSDARAMGGSRSFHDHVQSPLGNLGSTGSLAGSEEMGA
jgi:hypothetical protein